ncbi:hypothetical protein [Algoriphagus sp. AK58]|uniref:hypothetical protein n=1 Tax=Algoriphagus sp. AK58 TaxID=1406877 RepID=UPI00164F5472|nr:hypothetical protein [Algoriphagus sp. AK58]
MKRTGLPLKERKVFKFLREIGAFDEQNMPSDELLEKSYLSYDQENYRRYKWATIPRISSEDGYNWFYNLMKENLSKVS